MTNYEKTKRLCVTAVLSALAIVSVMLLGIRVGGFLTLDFKQVFLTIITFMYGPLYGIVSTAAVCIIECVTVSTTGIYGLIMNLAAALAYCSVAGLVYKKKRTLTGAVVALLLATVTMTVAMLIANLIVTPLYYGITVKEVIGMFLPLLLPFNVLKGILISAVILVLYKPVSNAVKRLSNNEGVQNDSKRGFVSVIIFVVALIIACGAVLALVLGMNGSFTVF